MGKAGKLPALTVKRADPLDRLDPPDWLTDPNAVELWETNAEFLAANLLLTRATADTFASVCDLWGRVRQMETGGKEYRDSLKLFHVLAKPFRLIPCDAPGQPMQRNADKKPFNFE